MDDDADVDLGEDEELKTTDAGAKKTSVLWRGMLLKELKPEESKKRGGTLEVTRVKKGSPADRAGLYEGAIITELKHGASAAIQKFNSLEEFRQITSQITDSAAIYVPLDGYVTIENK
jgi:S1-C subfamily serine protease